MYMSAVCVFMCVCMSRGERETVDGMLKSVRCWQNIRISAKNQNHESNCLRVRGLNGCDCFVL